MAKTTVLIEAFSWFCNYTNILVFYWKMNILRRKRPNWPSLLSRLFSITWVDEMFERPIAFKKKAAGWANDHCPWRLNTQYPAALRRKLPDKDSAGPIRARGCRGRVCMRTVPRATRRGKPVRMPYFTIKFRHLSRIQQVYLYMLFRLWRNVVTNIDIILFPCNKV